MRLSHRSPLYLSNFTHNVPDASDRVLPVRFRSRLIMVTAYQTESDMLLGIWHVGLLLAVLKRGPPSCQHFASASLDRFKVVIYKPAETFVALSIFLYLALRQVVVIDERQWPATSWQDVNW